MRKEIGARKENIYFSDIVLSSFPGNSNEHSPGCVSKAYRTSHCGQQSWPGLKLLTRFAEHLPWTQIHMSMWLALHWLIEQNEVSPLQISNSFIGSDGLSNSLRVTVGGSGTEFTQPIRTWIRSSCFESLCFPPHWSAFNLWIDARCKKFQLRSVLGPG